MAVKTFRLYNCTPVSTTPRFPKSGGSQRYNSVSRNSDPKPKSSREAAKGMNSPINHGETMLHFVPKTVIFHQ
jgi:hypothetical protein